MLFKGRLVLGPSQRVPGSERVTGINRLLMVEKGIRGGIWLAVHQNVNANNKYMEAYDRNK